HATQVDPDGQWFAVPLELQKKVWPTEDYELARSIVPVELPEDDLFAGIVELDDPDELCRRAPERDGDGEPVVAYVGPPALPPLEPGLEPRSTAPQDGDADE